MVATFHTRSIYLFKFSHIKLQVTTTRDALSVQKPVNISSSSVKPQVSPATAAAVITTAARQTPAITELIQPSTETDANRKSPVNIEDGISSMDKASDLTATSNSDLTTEKITPSISTSMGSRRSLRAALRRGR